jgi:signal transduction histidine kinase
LSIVLRVVLSSLIAAWAIGMLPAPWNTMVTAAALASLALFQAARRVSWLDLASARAEAAERRRRLNTVFNASSDGLLLYDSSRRVVAANPRCGELLGFTPDQLAAADVPALMADLEQRCADPDMYHERIEAHFADPTASHADELVLVEPRRRVLKRSSIPVAIDAGVGRVFTYTDITAESDLDRMKSEFVSTASHELRTPLTSIHAALQLVMSGSADRLEAEDREMLDITKSNAERLVRIVNDLLDLSKLEAGRASSDPCELNVSDLCDEVVSGLQAMASSRGIRVAVDAPVEMPLVADHDQIARVMTNLVGNAIKYSPEQSTVTVEVRASGADVQIAVADNGPGIPAEHVSRLFTPFSRLGVHERQTSGGTGLGLAISRAIVLRHGGQIWWERNQPTGSRFVVKLPGTETPAASAAA